MSHQPLNQLVTVAEPSSLDLTDGRLSREGDLDIPLCQRTELSLRGLYKYAADLERTGHGAAAGRLVTALDRAVEKAVGVIEAAFGDPDYRRWYLKNAEQEVSAEASEFDDEECFDSRDVLRDPESDLDFQICIFDKQERIANAERLSLAKIIEVLDEEVIGVNIIRLDPQGHRAGLEMTGVLPDYRGNGIGGSLMSFFMATCKALGIERVYAEKLDRFAMSEDEIEGHEQKTGIPMAVEDKHYQGLPARIADIITFQPGSRKSPRNIAVMLAFPSGEVPSEMPRDQFIEDYEWFTRRCLGIDEPKKDNGYTWTVQLLPNPIGFVEIGEPRECSLSIVETGAHRNEGRDSISYNSGAASAIIMHMRERGIAIADERAARLRS